MEQQEWTSLLDGLAGRIPDFVEIFVGELGSKALYDTERVPEEDVLRAAGETLEMLIARLRGDDTVLPGFARQLGQRRARQGVPLERLVEAIRMDLRIIWRLLRELAEPDRTEVLVQHGERVISVVDDYVNEVQQAFLAEVAILQRDSRLVTEQHLSRLFNATNLHQALVSEVAFGLGIDATSDFEVLLISPGGQEDRGRPETAHWLAKRDVFGYAFRGWLLLFRECTEGITTWPKDFAGIPSYYVHRVPGLQSLPGTALAAVELQSLAPEVQTLTDIEDLWAYGAAGHLESLIPGYFGSILEGLQQLPEDERTRVIDTVRAYLDSGSVKETSLRMHCHRNTVVNRTRLFHGVTGLDIMIPAQAALAYVLLAGKEHR